MRTRSPLGRARCPRPADVFLDVVAKADVVRVPSSLASHPYRSTARRLPPAPVSPWMKGVPERGLVPPLFPRSRASGATDRGNGALPCRVVSGRQRPAGCASQAEGTRRLTEDPLMSPISKSTLTSASMGVVMCVKNREPPERPRDQAIARIDLGVEGRRRGRFEHRSVYELDPNVGAVFGEGH